MRDNMDRRVTSPTLFFGILLNGDVFDKKFVTRNLNTLSLLLKGSLT